jgi:hypothetical protein
VKTATSETTAVEIVPQAAPPAVALAPATPEAMLMMAIERGANIETLERIMAMGEKLRKEAAERAFFDALAAAQGEFPPIEKTRVVEGRYKYASLDDLMDRITPVLQKHRLSTSFERAFVSNEAGLITAVSSALVVRHGDGHSHTFAPVVMPTDGAARMNKTQQVGCAMTYADRYAYQGGLGFRPCDEDTDANTHTSAAPPRTAQGSPPPAQAPQRASAAPAAPAQAQGPAASKSTGLPSGWREVVIERISVKKTTKGGDSFSIKIEGAPEDMKWPSTFDTKQGAMLQTAHDQQIPIQIRMERSGQWINIKEAKWVPGFEPLAPGHDDPQNYPPSEPDTTLDPDESLPF